jgi:hypothetical protein
MRVKGGRVRRAVSPAADGGESWKRCLALMRVQVVRRRTPRAK